ncbi:MAG: hypothetical protein AAF513_07270 [Pseudomonadota bacterium]
MSRFSAAGIHLAISFVIFVGLAYLIVFEWYPGIFFDTDGGWRGMRIIVAVDMVLGPLLTLVVYKHGKPGLKTDLTLIALLQAVCLTAGTYVVYSERPISVVYVDGRITVMSGDDYRAAGLEVPDMSIYPGDAPRWVMVDVPQEIEAQADFRTAMFKARKPLNIAIEHYIPFSTTHPQFTLNPLDQSIILARDEGPAEMTRWVTRHGGKPADYNFYLFTTRYIYKYAGFNQAGELLGFLALQPH